MEFQTSVKGTGIYQQLLGDLCTLVPLTRIADTFPLICRQSTSWTIAAIVKTMENDQQLCKWRQIPDHM